MPFASRYRNDASLHRPRLERLREELRRFIVEPGGMLMKKANLKRGSFGAKATVWSVFVSVGALAACGNSDGGGGGGAGAGGAGAAGGGGGAGGGVNVAMTAVDAESMLEDNVTKNVTKILVVASDSSGKTISNQPLTREAAASFSVPTNAAKAELKLITAADKQVGVIIFEPEGDEMTLTLPGDGMTPYQVLKLDIVINADMWDTEARMMAAGLGFSNIIGVDGVTGTDSASEDASIDAGGTWGTVTGCGDVTPATGNYTSAVSPQAVALVWGPPLVANAGGMPIEFSWPALLSTVQGTDFLVTLNDGSQVGAVVGASSPNSDYNERACIVVFGQFGNRLELSDPDVRFPVKIEVVEDDTPMMLIGPDGSLKSAVGMYAYAPGSPYHTPGNGPKLTGAKLNVMSAVGDGGPPGFNSHTPNDGIALYGDDAQYRLRVFTTGGYTPDGVTGLKPDQYDNFFQVQVRNDAGELVLIEDAGVEYTVDGDTIEVVGLAELGVPGQVVDGNDCYADDKDNQIDIILKGDVGAMRKITGVRVPSQEPAGAHTPDGYWQFYNPGGPSNDPTPGTTYVQGSPDHTVLVTQALDDPMTVTYIDLRTSD
jgi:hypothetical protein